MIVHESRFPDVTLRNCSITERVFEGLVHRPDAAVLIDGPTGRAVTARELIAGIKSLAGGLTAHNYGAGHRVALMAPNIPEFCTILHAIFWSGGTATTVNPTYTAAELHHQLSDSGAELLITVPAFLDTAREGASGTGVREIVVIGEAGGAKPLSALMGQPIEHQVPVDLDAHTALLPYSSGTTGLPKGVMLSHRNLVVNVDQITFMRVVDPGEVTLAFLPFFHIYGLEVLINVYLAGGASVVTMPRFDLEMFLRLAQEHRVRRLWVVPPVATALAKHPLVDKYDLSSVVHVNSAAAPLGAALSDAVAARLGCVAGQGYGMTELSPASHFVMPETPRSGAVGQALPSTRSRIVDVETGEDLPVGKEGEVWVQGPQVMQGYLNNPEATARTVDPEGWLRTGDIGCFDEDGYLYIRDRVKELIKVKGFQVPPAELEAALMTHPGVTDAAVIGIPDDECGEVPMAFVVPAAGAELTLGDLQGHLAGRLASYKQIQRVAFVEAIPKSASGKILRRVLREKA